jgi:hypothetical protein
MNTQNATITVDDKSDHSYVLLALSDSELSGI